MTKRDVFRNINKFAFYYGPPNIQALGAYDCVIVEPSRLDDEDIKTLQEMGTLVIGYVTVMEVGPFHQPEWSLLTESDFLHRNGQRIGKSEYNTFLLDLTSARWRSLLQQQVGKLVTQRGFDGIFLDTIGDVEDYALPFYDSQVEAATEIVSEFRSRFPDTIVLQNNGLEALCLLTAPFLDGIVWENPPVSQRVSRNWVRLIAERLDGLVQSQGIKVMTLYDKAESMPRREWIVRRRFADAHGYLSYFAPTHYLSFL